MQEQTKLIPEHTQENRHTFFNPNSTTLSQSPTTSIFYSLLLSFFHLNLISIPCLFFLLRLCPTKMGKFILCFQKLYLNFFLITCINVAMIHKIAGYCSVGLNKYVPSQSKLT